MDYVKYDFGFMFAYSERPGTLAAKKISDDIEDNIKKERLNEIIKKQQKHSLYRSCLLYTSPSPRDPKTSRMPSSA